MDVEYVISLRPPAASLLKKALLPSRCSFSLEMCSGLVTIEFNVCTFTATLMRFILPLKLSLRRCLEGRNPIPSPASIYESILYNGNAAYPIYMSMLGIRTVIFGLSLRSVALRDDGLPAAAAGRVIKLLCMRIRPYSKLVNKVQILCQFALLPLLSLTALYMSTLYSRKCTSVTVYTICVCERYTVCIILHTNATEK